MLQAMASLLLLRQDHLLSLAASWHRSLLAVPSHVFLLSLERGKLLVLDLARLLHSFGHASVTGNTSNLRHVSVSLLEGVIVLELLALACALDTAPGGRVGAPETDVAVV